jgi:hypothetical protein
MGVRKQGCMALIQIPACVLRKADDDAEMAVRVLMPTSPAPHPTTRSS